MGTIKTSIEVLKVFGEDAIRTAFTNTEVLGLRNVFGEGTSLTHEVITCKLYINNLQVA